MASGYTQDVEFNSAFGVLQTPVHLLTACLIAGSAAPSIEQPFRYLDLACGNGLTIALLADAYPHAEFVGIDINPRHVVDAQDRARAAGLSNLKIHQGDIESLNSAEFEAFDFAAIGGAYSWLDEDRQLRAREFLSNVIRPGGVLYLDYSAQPGMAQSASLYHMLQRLALNENGTSAEKLAAAAKTADELRVAGARFFEFNPSAQSRLQAIVQNRPEDEAHEVLNLQGYGIWSADVIKDMRASGFEFAADCGLHHNVESLSGFDAAFDQSASLSIEQCQTLLDVKRNVPHRRDVYIRGRSSDSFDLLDALSRRALFSVPGSLRAENRSNLNRQFSGLQLRDNASDTFAEIVTEHTRFGDLFDSLRNIGWTETEIARVTRNFLAFRLISIAVFERAPTVDLNRLTMPSALNRMILKDDIGEQHVRPFASPVVGTRVLMPVKDRLYLWALLGLDLSEAWGKIGDMRSSFVDARGRAVDRESFVQTIEQSLEGFKRVVAPELLRLRILHAE